MEHDNNWLFFNIHDLVRLRVQAGHASERSVRLVFGPFEVGSLDHVDITLQYQPPEIGEHSFASESYLFTQKHVYLNSYKLHLVQEDKGYILASKRDLLPFVNPVIQTILIRKNHCFVHGAAVAVDGRGVLLPGWGGTGKTSAIISLLNEVPGAAFLGDDYTIIAADGRLLSFPKAFFIYPYHRNLFPHLFKRKHKPLVPPFLSGVLEKVRTVVRPTVMAFPTLENIARRITPEHMQIPARTALLEAEILENVPLRSVLFVERYSGTKTQMDELPLPKVIRRLIGNWNYEQGRCAIDLLVGAGGTAVLDLKEYYAGMAEVLEKALQGYTAYRLRMGEMTPTQTGQAIVQAVQQITSSR